VPGATPVALIVGDHVLLSGPAQLVFSGEIALA